MIKALHRLNPRHTVYVGDTGASAWSYGIHMEQTYKITSNAVFSFNLFHHMNTQQVQARQGLLCLVMRWPHPAFLQLKMEMPWHLNEIQRVVCQMYSK